MALLPAPKGLRKRGRKLWRDLTGLYSMRPDELVLLENACRMVDLIAELEEKMIEEPLIVKGSAGQLRENPLLSETRLQRTTLRQTLAQLKLPDLDAFPTVNQHREAGMSRWRKERGV